MFQTEIVIKRQKLPIAILILCKKCNMQLFQPGFNKHFTTERLVAGVCVLAFQFAWHQTKLIQSKFRGVTILVVSPQHNAVVNIYKLENILPYDDPDIDIAWYRQVPDRFPALPPTFRNTHRALCCNLVLFVICPLAVS